LAPSMPCSATDCAPAGALANSATKQIKPIAGHRGTGFAGPLVASP
jgi:hypothetical protein